MNNQPKYQCVFGPDASGSYLTKIVTSIEASQCDSFCDCEGLTDNTCLFGPDAEGNFFIDYEVSSETVDSCTEDWCLCDKHQKVINQMEAENLQFVQIAQAYTETVPDLTIKPGEISEKRPAVIIDKATGVEANQIPSKTNMINSVDV